MTQWINRAMMAVFFLALGGFLVWSAMHRPRVFVLQSYTTDYSWTRDVDGAIRKVLAGKPYDVKYHYMDTKRHPDPEFKRVAGALVRKRINEWKPNVLIAVDDNAQSLVAICYMDPKKRWDLRLMSVSATDELVDEGRSLVIVALVDTDLHIRIFDASGEKVVDKAESELVAGATLTTLKRRLSPFPDESSLSPQDEQEIIADATSITGHTPSDLFGACHEEHPELNVVFAGIGAQPEDYDYGNQDNVTGIVERIDFPALKETLRIIAQEMERCHIRLLVASDCSNEEELIRKFETEFESRKRACAVLIVRAASDSEKWTIAGFSDAGEFRTVVIDDPSHELSKELKKERIDESKIVELATSSLGRTRIDSPPLRVVAPIDDSTSGNYNADSLRQFKTDLKPMGISIDVRQIKSFPEWRTLVEEANANADLLLFSNYHTVRCTTDSADTRRASPAKLIEWTEANSRIPGIGAWGFYVEDGGMLSVGVSPYEQGERAARLAVEILDHRVKPRDLAVETTRQSLVFMREPLMRYYGLELPRIYEAFARATGNFHECSGCDIRSMVASDGNDEREMIREFEVEFESKKEECAVLIVRVTGDSDRWTIAGFSDAGEFRIVVIDDPSHELSKELKKGPTSESKIVQLATSCVGHAHGDCGQDILEIIESKKRERRAQSTVCADDSPHSGG